MLDHRDLWWSSPTVELGQVVHLDLPEPFTAVHGGKLPSIQVSYESWGELNAARDNAVLIVHPMTADCHVTGEYAEQPTGWWESLIGPGRAVDTDSQFVVCPNLIGGCYGTTGPRFPAGDGKPYLDRFPLLTPRDMMRVQRLFLEAIGVERVAMVIGPSMGAMIVWEWAIEAPELVDLAVVVAAPLRTSPHQIGLNWLQRRGIELDITEDEVVRKVGQMVARGVGMMSYRSPVGLEAKFGREWFKRPGSTLRDRGMYNVESWLRHHGRRITKRFDPYTYLLYSRAMDLHDVSEGRGDMVNALNRVTCHLLIMGISSDNLYPPAEVKLGADILARLGRDVHYGEIRSPNGHDAFLLDTDQIAAILGDLRSGRVWGAGVSDGRVVKTVKVGILGAGKVAASFVNLVAQRRQQMAERNSLSVEVVAVAEIDAEKQLDPVFHGVSVGYDPDALVDREDLDVVVDLTRGPGAVGLLAKALHNRMHVVSPNKVLLREHGDLLDRLAFEYGVRLAYHDSIAAGWPLIHALERPLTQGRVWGIQAVLSSACNVVLELIEQGVPFKDAAAEVIVRELTEPDPELDFSGWDTAQKLTLLLARATGRRYLGQKLATIGIDTLDEQLVRQAPDMGLRVKLVALADAAAGELVAAVRPMAVRTESHLGMVKGQNNAVVIYAPDGGEMVYLGSGGGDLPVATAVLNDLIGLFDTGYSWTGRFPAVDESLPAPSFSDWLVLHEGAPVRASESPDGGIPVLGVVR
ncbi:MAG: homoserine O-acetyltransferase [Gemmatimonadota bacterium]|nr:MAG: homoserine O-acetyltransferase [Gemmatimonadota bacterium]